MKKTWIAVCTVAMATLLTGCLGLQIGGGERRHEQRATLGQQLVDLKAARDSGALTDAEYELQKARLLRSQH
jgi:hypothetical protein